MTLTNKELESIDGFFRAANYLSVATIYLQDNVLLKRNLKFSDIKSRLIGHFGSAPNQNFIYTHLNRVIKKYDLDMIYLSGPGHGGNAIVSNVYLGGIVGYAMVTGNIDVTIQNCALVGALYEEAETNKDSLLVNVGGICGLSNAKLFYTYRDGSINVRATTKSKVATDTIEVNVGGLSTQSALDGCFVTGGTIIGTLIVDKESAVTRSNCKLNILIMTMTDEINNSLFDESYLDTEERRMVGIFNYKDAANPFTGQTYKEIRNTTLDNTTLTSYASTQLKPYNLTTINQSNISAVFKTLYLLGFKQYKNVVDITKNPENAWNIVAGYLPRLFWI